MIDEYTRILESAAEIGDDKVADEAVTKLIVHLKSMGRMKMLPQIVRELKKIAAKRNALAPLLEVAHEKDAAHALKEAAAAGIHAQKAHMNHALISGWRAREAGKLVDHSGKRALVDIYQKVTSV